MRAEGGCLEIFAIALVADGPKALLEHHIGETMMALRGVLISWLIWRGNRIRGARCSAALGLEYSSRRVAKGDDVAEDRAESMHDVADADEGNETRDQAAFAHLAIISRPSFKKARENYRRPTSR